MEQIALTYGGDHAQVQSVLLLTDGHANHGITSKEAIVEEIKKMQEQGLHAVNMEGVPRLRSRGSPRKAAQPQQQRGWFDFLFGRRTPQQQQQPPVLQQQAPPPVLQQQAPAPVQQQQQQVPKLELAEPQTEREASKPTPPGDKVANNSFQLHDQYYYNNDTDHTSV